LPSRAVCSRIDPAFPIIDITAVGAPDWSVLGVPNKRAARKAVRACATDHRDFSTSQQWRVARDPYFEKSGLIAGH